MNIPLQEIHDARCLIRQKMIAVFDEADLGVRGGPLQPFPRVSRVQQNIPSTDDRQDRHAEFAELGVRQLRNADHPRLDGPSYAVP